MPTAVPITFPNAQRSSAEHPVMISPTMQWRGSPMSMSYSILARSFGRSQSFNAMLGTSPGPLSAAFSELNDFRVNGVPSSLESEAGKILRALQGEEALSKELTQNYSCCGFDLADLHALLEHFEEFHVVVVDSPSLGPTRVGGPADGGANDDDGAQSAFDPDAMDLDSAPSSSASTPPSTPPIDAAHAASSAFDNNTILRASRGLAKASMSGYNTPRGTSPHPSIGPDGMLTSGRNNSLNGSETAFNPYASYSDFSALMPGTVRTPIHQSPPLLPANAIKNGDANGNAKCIPPALLFSPSATPSGSPSQSRMSTPTPTSTTPANPLSRAGSLSGPNGSNGASGGITSASLMSLANHQASSSSASSSNPAKKSSMSGASGAAAGASSNGGGGLVSKPFRCPTVGCNKSYKQANGLKYHITHGQCNFMPRDPALEGLNDTEADEKARPYVCQVGSCTRRYKNMNGLRYHYQHSGQHGAVGLALLASGQHSLQTGLKDAGVELPPQIKEQHLLAAQALQRQQAQPLHQQQQQGHPSQQQHPHQSLQPAYLSQQQQLQAQAAHQQQQQHQVHAALEARAQAEQQRLAREQEAMAIVQQRLPAQKTPPSASSALANSNPSTQKQPGQKTPPAALTSLMTTGVSGAGAGRPSPATTSFPTTSLLSAGAGGNAFAQHQTAQTQQRREPESFAMQM